MTTLKRWESPRKTGRNDKGRGGSARQRQLRKREKRLRQHLKSDSANDSQKSNSSQKGEVADLFFFIAAFSVTLLADRL